ncbi:helix-turn-helix domain-containing protein [Williamsia sp. MIQD14]|uniref:helix-turn-helix domain-containing protein n=1 Tax=Williamsia sp. MIQD14 TaxID=3425703 RepID=UPI003DA0D3C7
MTDPSTDTDSVLAAVGPRLRALRTRREATLTEVSEATGISVSTLSRLESGQRRPTLEQLLPLAREYRVALDDLVGAPETGDPRITLRPIDRHGRTYLPLTRRAGGLQAYKVVIPTARPGDRVTTGSHEGYEWLYVLDGHVRFVLGDRDLELAPGEAAEFDTHLPHWIGTTDRGPAEVLMLFGKQGERAHVRTDD